MAAAPAAGRHDGCILHVTGLHPSVQARDVAQLLLHKVACRTPSIQLADQLKDCEAEQWAALEVKLNTVEGRMDILQQLHGHVVQQCRVLAIAHDPPPPLHEPQPWGPQPAGSVVTGPYRVEAVVALKSPDFMDALLIAGQPQRVLTLEGPQASMAINSQSLILQREDLNNKRHQHLGGKWHAGMDAVVRLSAVSLGNLVPISSLPSSMMGKKKGKKADKAEPATEQHQEQQQEQGLVCSSERDAHDARVLSQWWSSVAPACKPTQLTSPPPPEVTRQHSAAVAPAAAARPPPPPPPRRQQTAPAALLPPAPPIASSKRVSGDAGGLGVSLAKNCLQVTFNKRQWQCMFGGQQPGHLDKELSKMLASQGGKVVGDHVRLVFPFRILRGRISVRVLDPKASCKLHPQPLALQVPMQRYQLVVDVRAPPEVHMQLCDKDVQADRQRRLDAMCRSPPQTAGDWEGPWMCGRDQITHLDHWPPGSILADARSYWARAGDFTGAGVAGHCLAYVFSVWDTPASGDVRQVLDLLVEYGLADTPDKWMVLAPPLPTVPCHPATAKQVVRQMMDLKPPMAQEVMYALVCLTSSGLLPWECVTPELLRLLSKYRPPVAEAALYSCHAAGQWLGERPLAAIKKQLNAQQEQRGVLQDIAHTGALSGVNCCVTRRVLITPTRLVCQPPEADLSNRVLRHYAQHRDHFVRVSFADELGNQLFLTAASMEPMGGPHRKGKVKAKGAPDNVVNIQAIGEAWTRLIIQRWHHFLSKGFDLIGRHHQVLAFSSNQTRTASAWFMAPVFPHHLSDQQLLCEQAEGRLAGFPEWEGWQPGQPRPRTHGPLLDAHGVRYWLGSFVGEKCPAKVAARMAQAFTATVAGVAYTYNPADVLQATPEAGAPAPFADAANSTLLSHAVDCSEEQNSLALGSQEEEPSKAAHVQRVESDATCSTELIASSGSDSSASLTSSEASLATLPADLPDSVLTPVSSCALLPSSSCALLPSASSCPLPVGAEACDPEGLQQSGKAVERQATPGLPTTLSTVVELSYPDWRWPREEVEFEAEEDPMFIPDIVVIDQQDHAGRVKYIVSDGVGRMGMAVAADLMESVGLDRSRPLAVQCRFGGCKGMLVPWPAGILHPNTIELRKSMAKFDSTHTEVEVVQVASFVPGFINRQIILLLLTNGLGKDDKCPRHGDQAMGHSDQQQQPRHRRLCSCGQVLLRKAQEMTRRLDAMVSDDAHCVRMLRRLGFVDMTTCRLVEQALAAGMTVHEPWIQGLLQHTRTYALTMLRGKHRIFLSESAFLLGVLDETGELQEDEVFVQVHQPGEEQPVVIKDKWMLVTKNPCLHPGDLRILHAVDKPGLRHLVNVVVFPQRVKRPITDMISGSDLDGDQYFCLWDQELIPINPKTGQPVVAEPANYEAQPPFQVDKVEMDPHLIDQYLRFQVNDTLGMIANSHVAVADQHPLFAACEVCLELSGKHSEQVDLPKTCRHVSLPKCLQPKEYPHFMEKSDKRQYKSKTVLGRIYDWANTGSGASAAGPLRPPVLDARLLLKDDPWWQVEVAMACEVQDAYNTELLRLMRKYGANNEYELLTGCMVIITGQHVRKREGLKQQVLLEAGILRRKYQRLFLALPVPGGDGSLLASTDDLAREAYLQPAACEAVVHGVIASSAPQPAVRGIPGVAAANACRRAGTSAAAAAAAAGTGRGWWGAPGPVSDELQQVLLVRASAWYYVAYEPTASKKSALRDLLQAAEQDGAAGAGMGAACQGGNHSTATRGPQQPCVGPQAAAGAARKGPPPRLLSFGWLQMQGLLHGLQARQLNT